MPQLSPLNWAFLSITILFLIFMTKVFFSFMTMVKLNFVYLNMKSSESFSKWFW